MKLVLALMLSMGVAISAYATAVATDASKKDAKPAAVQNDNCVKKDKNGKCPPLPDSPKPTPKKKTEATK